MRKAFIDIFTELVQKDSKLLLLIGDVGFSFLDEFKKNFSEQIINCGIMEQDMMGTAVGLTKAGFKPWVYSMINFVTMRPFEQVRNDIGYQNSNVKLLGVKGSEAYKFLGFSHNIEENEDVHLMSRIPNMNIYIPQTEEETKDIIKKEYARQGPAYIRL